jgi:hypothetical protein
VTDMTDANMSDVCIFILLLLGSVPTSGPLQGAQKPGVGQSESVAHQIYLEARRTRA